MVTADGGQRPPRSGASLHQAGERKQGGVQGSASTPSPISTPPTRIGPSSCRRQSRWLRGECSGQQVDAGEDPTVPAATGGGGRATRSTQRRLQPQASAAAIARSAMSCVMTRVLPPLLQVLSGEGGDLDERRRQRRVLDFRGSRYRDTGHVGDRLVIPHVCPPG